MTSGSFNCFTFVWEIMISSSFVPMSLSRRCYREEVSQRHESELEWRQIQQQSVFENETWHQRRWIHPKLTDFKLHIVFPLHSSSHSFHAPTPVSWGKCTLGIAVCSRSWEHRLVPDILSNTLSKSLATVEWTSRVAWRFKARKLSNCVNHTLLSMRQKRLEPKWTPPTCIHLFSKPTVLIYLVRDAK